MTLDRPRLFPGGYAPRPPWLALRARFLIACIICTQMSLLQLCSPISRFSPTTHPLCDPPKTLITNPPNAFKMRRFGCFYVYICILFYIKSTARMFPSRQMRPFVCPYYECAWLIDANSLNLVISLLWHFAILSNCTHLEASKCKMRLSQNVQYRHF